MSGQSGGHRLLLSKLNDQLKCTLCSGYLIDATTIIECLHSFCRSCIVKYLEINKYCPICEVLVHKSKPLLNIRPDHTLQDIVYKLVPGCYQNEMRCRREYYAKNPDGKSASLSPESRGEPIESHIYSPDESLSLSLEYYNPDVNSDCEDDKEGRKLLPKRYLRCPAAVTIFHLQKLIRAKYGLSEAHRVDIMYKEEALCGSYTLMDVMYIYHWRRKVPLHLSYRIFESSPKRIKLADDNSEFKQSLSNSGISSIEGKDEQSTKRGWKEVQLKISEAGVMSVTDITSPESKKSTKLDGPSNEDLEQKLDTSPSVNKSLALDEGTAKTSTSKSKNLTSDFDEKKLVSLDTKRKETNAEIKTKRDTKDKDIKERKDNKREKRDLTVKNKKEEADNSTRLQETEKLAKRLENQKKNTGGAKIDALSAKLQFQPKVGQVNNTYSKKNLKKQPVKLDTKKETKKSTESCSKNTVENPVENKSSDNIAKILEILSKSAENTTKKNTAKSTTKTSENLSPKNVKNTTENLETCLKNVESLTKNVEIGSKTVETCLKNVDNYSKTVEIDEKKTKNTENDSKIQESLKKETEISKKAESVTKPGDIVENTENGKNGSKSAEGTKSTAVMNSVATYVTAPSISSDKNQSGSLQQTLPTLGKSGDSKTILNQVNITQKTNFRNNNLSSSESASPNFGFTIPDLGSPSKVKTPSGSSSSSVQFPAKSMPQFEFNVQPSMSIYSISEKNNHLFNQSSSSKSDFEIYPVQDTIPMSLMKSTIRKNEVIAKGTNLNEICAKIGTSGSKINDICAKIGENSKEKKTERRADLPDLLKITKSSEFLKHIPNIPNVPIYTPSGNSKDKSCTLTGQKLPQKKQSHVGYKTLRDPPKSWNPTLSKNNYVAVKNQNQFQDGSTSKPILSKPAKIFKMRNMPRYLGNPASGVKPMYGVSSEKEKEVSKNNLNAITMMKIDPKTLSPIVSTSNSPIVSPPPYSPNARSYQNSPFSRDICRNSGSPISPRNSPVNMLSTNPFIPSPTPNTNPRLIYSHFPPPFPDPSRFPNPLIRTPVGIPPPSAFHSSLPPSINKLYQRTSFLPQTSGYNPVPVTQPPTVQRIPPSTSSTRCETTVSSSSEPSKSDKVFNLTKCEKPEEKVDLKSKINGDIVDLEEEEDKRSEVNSLKDLSQKKDSKGLLASKEVKETTKEQQSLKENSCQSTKVSSPKDSQVTKISSPKKEDETQSAKISSLVETKDCGASTELANDGLKSKDSTKEKEPKDEGSKTTEEKSREVLQTEEIDKEIQGKRTEIQRNEAES